MVILRLFYYDIFWYNQLMKKLNLLENIVIDKKNEEFLQLLQNENLQIERIVSNGQTSPDNFWYDQEKSEFVLLLEGEAIIEFENEEVELFKGDCINIEAHRKHRVKYTSQTQATIWLAIFY